MVVLHFQLLEAVDPGLDLLVVELVSRQAADVSSFCEEQRLLLFRDKLFPGDILLGDKSDFREEPQQVRALRATRGMHCQNFQVVVFKLIKCDLAVSLHVIVVAYGPLQAGHNHGLVFLQLEVNLLYDEIFLQLFFVQLLVGVDLPIVLDFKLLFVFKLIFGSVEQVVELILLLLSLLSLSGLFLLFQLDSVRLLLPEILLTV